jgi:Pectate lyase superfamily protein
LPRAARVRAAPRRWVVALIAILLLPTLLAVASPFSPVAEAALSRIGNRWIVTPGSAAEIQQAIDSARSVGGGRVHLPAGVYLLTSKVRLHDNVYVYGDGIDQTIYIGYNHDDGVVNGAINVRDSGCRATQNGRNGIALIHGDGNIIDGCQVNNNNRSEAVAGIDVEPDQGLSVTNSRIVNNTANGQNVGIQIFLPFNGYATTYHNAVCYNTTMGNVSAGVYSHRGDQNIFVGNDSSGNGTNFLVDDSSLFGPADTSWCTLGALPPHPSTLDTPSAPPSCSPRPTISVTVQRGTPGRLNASVAATRPASAPNNSIYQLQVGPAQNATVEINGQSRTGGNFTAYTAAGTQQVAFVVRRTPANAPSTTVPFTVTDDCGAWKSFVGGGAHAF